MIVLPIQHADTAWSGFEPLAPILSTRRAICRAQLAAMEDDTMPAQWRDDIAAARYGMAVYTSRPMPLERRPYIPDGCDQQGRLRTGTRWPQYPTDPMPLTEDELDAHNEEFHPRIERNIFAKPSLLRRLWAWWRVWRANLMGPKL